MMTTKTFYKRPLDPNKARARQIELECSTGVKWDYYFAHGGTVFTPVTTKDTEAAQSGDSVLKVLTRKPMGFLEVARLTQLDLPEVLAQSMHLIRAGLAHPVVNRCGHVAGLYKS